MKFPKQGKVVLKGIDYVRFKRWIHERDRWTCKNPFCRSRKNLTLAHYVPRSKLRLDTQENCYTLCVECHELEERGDLIVEKVGRNMYRFCYRNRNK
ncbi:MAG: HNH endonuclease [Thermodesulfobacteriota bacterium]